MLTNLHSCVAIAQENDKLKERIQKLKYELRNARSTLRKQEETVNENNYHHDSIGVQTDVCTANISPRRVQPLACETPLLDRKRLERLQVIYKQLLRRFEKEKQDNIEKSETVTMQNLKVRELELKLREKDFELEVVRKENVVLKEICEETKARFFGRTNPRQSKRPNSSFGGDWDALIRSKLRSDTQKPKKQTGVDTIALGSLTEEMTRLKSECERLRRDKRAMERELGQLDVGFFEEIEDLKFALAESNRLNSEYDRFLKQLAKMYRFEMPAQLRVAAK